MADSDMILPVCVMRTIGVDTAPQPPPPPPAPASWDANCSLERLRVAAEASGAPTRNVPIVNGNTDYHDRFCEEDFHHEGEVLFGIDRARRSCVAFRVRVAFDDAKACPEPVELRPIILAVFQRYTGGEMHVVCASEGRGYGVEFNAVLCALGMNGIPVNDWETLVHLFSGEPLRTTIRIPGINMKWNDESPGTIVRI